MLHEFELFPNSDRSTESLLQTSSESIAAAVFILYFLGRP